MYVPLGIRGTVVVTATKVRTGGSAVCSPEGEKYFTFLDSLYTISEVQEHSCSMESRFSS